MSHFRLTMIFETKLSNFSLRHQKERENPKTTIQPIHEVQKKKKVFAGMNRKKMPRTSPHPLGNNCCTFMLRTHGDRCAYLDTW